MSRPLVTPAPVIEIAVGYRADNPSPVLQDFLKNIDCLIAARSAIAVSGSLACLMGRSPPTWLTFRVSIAVLETGCTFTGG